MPAASGAGCGSGRSAHRRQGELYRWLKLEWPTDEALEEGANYPPGVCHFPQYGEEYFKQLTAERLVTRIVKGFRRGSWEKEPGRRNEALDCRAYARAAAAIFGLDRSKSGIGGG
jgi:phage terminase large subunit GpA-like protein